MLHLIKKAPFFRQTLAHAGPASRQAFLEATTLQALVTAFFAMIIEHLRAIVARLPAPEPRGEETRPTPNSPTKHRKSPTSRTHGRRTRARAAQDESVQALPRIPHVQAAPEAQAPRARFARALPLAKSRAPPHRYTQKRRLAPAPSHVYFVTIS